MTIPTCPVCKQRDATYDARNLGGLKPWWCLHCNTVYSGTEDEARESRWQAKIHADTRRCWATNAGRVYPTTTKSGTTTGITEPSRGAA